MSNVHRLYMKSCTLTVLGCLPQGVDWVFHTDLNVGKWNMYRMSVLGGVTLLVCLHENCMTP